MLYPSINDLLTKIDNRYNLVIAVSKRARMLIDGDEKLVNIGENKPVDIATHEVAEDKITYRAMTAEEIENEGKTEEEPKSETNEKIEE
ncbi:DNA-directed RNA polymerase subunit omega [Tepidibacter formicigenes]|jgi:DNA-directed RNA polymerase subunit omega|uniref:DNA-directed RNA polymerase subunit omega n=1 Tax=Tepidibacter formicigenes DSM 15518 TaxID=1123349 RepID=A0A1M6KGK5_9FIRM|nr:DNA-directed RNA polymerase subunit omega [Tepidibacter formicigenes]SHJ58017.1 DNA-directed RNA polymerase subunit omega [Tepidibacter formicigenes DSM 15518]